MAKAKAKLASSKPVATSWLNNAMRSIGVSTKNVIKSEFPNIYETVDTGINASKSVINTLRRNAGGANQLSQQMQNNKYVKFAQTAYKNALSDLRSGNLNNEDRATSSMFGDSGNMDADSLFEDSGISFGDDGADTVNVNVVDTSNNNDAVFALTSQMQKQTEATLKTSQANLNATIAMNSAAMVQHQQTSSLIVSGIDAINKNLSSLVEYNNTNLNKFIESSMAFYERMGAKMDSSGDSTAEGDKKLQATDVLNGSSGGINFSQYKQLIKQQFKDTFSKTDLGMITGLLSDEMLGMAAANPLGFATEGLIKFMVPKILTNTIKGVEETYSSFMPAMLHKLSEWGDSAATGVLGKAKQFIGKIFGIKIERAEKINTGAAINKGPIPFDGQTKHAITEIITKELREQTSYLSVIAKHFDKEGAAAAKSNAEVFDYKTGKYITVSQVTENIATEIRDAILGPLNESAFGKSLRSYKDNLTDQSQIDALNNGLDEFMVRLEKAGVIKLNDNEFNNTDSEYNKLLASMNGSDDIKKLVDDAVKNMVAKDPNALSNMSSAVLRAQSSRNNIVKEIGSNTIDYNTYAAQLGDKTIDDIVYENLKKRANTNATIVSNTTKTDDKDATSILSDAKSALSNFFGGDKEKKEGEGGVFEQTLNRFSDGIKKTATSFIHGSGEEALDAFASMMKDNFKTIWTKFDETFLTPFKTNLFGTKNKDTGFNEGGIFSGLSNGFKDAAGMIKHYITGKEYKDSKGEVHKIKEGQTSVLGNFKKVGTQVKTGVMETLFGKDVIDEKGNITGEKKGGLLTGFKESIQTGLQGWKDALFGKEEDRTEQQKKAQSQIISTIKKRLPDAATGGAIGAGVGIMAGGSLLGTLIGGPIGGAAIGTAVGFIAKSEKFQNFLFGEEDKDGNRVGGLISKELQEHFKNNKETALASGAIGAVGGALTGGGVLGTLVGGPIAGALIGMGGSLIYKSDKFQTFLFGEADENGNRSGGAWDKFKQKLSSFGQTDDKDPNAKKLGGMAAIGAVGGGLLGALVGGPVVGSVLGLGASILAQKDNFHEWFFGKTDEQGNKKEGVLGKFRNMLTVNVFRPIGNMFKDIGADFKTFLKYDVIERVRISMEPITDMVSNTLSSITKSTVTAIGNVGNYIKENFLDNFIEKTGKLLAPLTNVVKGVTKTVYSIGKSIVSAPLKLLSAITSPIAQSVGRVVTGFAKTAFKGINMLIVKPIKNLVLKPLAVVAKGLGKIVAAPFKLLGKVATKLTNTITGFIDHLGNFTRKLGEHIKDKFEKSFVGRLLQKKKEDAKEFAQHVKDTAIQFISPLTDFVKVTIKSVGQHIKDKISGVTNWLFGKASELFKNIFSRKKDKDGKEKKESTLARIWRETAPGKRTDMDATIDPEASQSKQRKSLGQIIKEERERNKKAAEERKKLEANEKLIAKYTGNQRKDFTEENKRLAEYEAKKKGITINWEDVETRKTKEEEMQEQELDAQKETSENTGEIRKTLDEIADFIFGRTKKNAEKEKVEQAEKGRSEGAETAQRDADIADQKKNAETKSEKKDAKKAEKDQAEARKKESEQRQEEMAKNLAGKKETGMTFGEGVKANWARLTGHWKGLHEARKAEKEKKNEDAKLAEGDSVELNPEEVKKVSAISKLLGKFKGKGHAKGTDDTGDEAAIVGENGPELVNFSKGSKVFANSKPLGVVLVGVTANAINNAITGIFSFMNKFNNMSNRSQAGGHYSETDADSADIRSLAVRNASIGGGSNALSLISGLNGGNAGEEVEDDLHAATTMIDSQNRLDAAQDAGHTAAELQEHREKEEAKEQAKEQTAELKKLNETQEKHAFNWSSIFSKKGLITAGLALAAPLLIKALPTIIDTVKNIAKGIGTFVSGVAKQFGWTMDNGALGDGDSMGDKLGQNVTRATSLIDPTKSTTEKIKGFVLNENGQIDHQSDANAKLLVSGAANTMRKGGKAAKKFIESGIKFADTKVGKAVTSTVSKAGGAIKKGATKIADAASNLLKPVLDSASKWIDDLIKALAKKGIKIPTNVFSNILSNMKNIVTKYFGKISAKIAKIFTKEGAIAASNVIAGAGLIIKATEITLSALNGATGAARLFQVDSEHVDGKMTLISTLLGAAQGTMIGSIIDVINELIASVTGVDMLTEIAVAIYNFIAGGEKAEALKVARQSFKDDYIKYQDAELSKQYETAKKAGIIDSGLSYDDYKQGVKDGTYEAKYDSFVDYNDKQHKTAGTKIVSAIGKGFKAVGKGISKGWSAVFGKTDKHLEDVNGTKYYDNGDGTYQVVSALGTDIGYISKEALPKELSEKKTRKKGIFEKGFNGVKSFFAGSKNTVYYATDGSYYDSKGIHYTASGEKIGEISTDELQTMIVAGTVTKGEIQKEAGIKTLGKNMAAGLKSLGNGISNGWNKFKEGASKVGPAIKEGATKLWNKATELGNKIKTGIGNFFTADKETVYFATDGSFYDEAGKHYTATGEELGDTIDLITLTSMISNGSLTEGSRIIRQAGIVELKDKAVNAIKDGWKSFTNGIVKVGTAIKDGAIKVWNKATTFVSNAATKVKNFFIDHKEKAWFDSNGCYYRSNGKTFDYYNATGDKIGEISAEEFNSIMNTLTEGEVNIPSGLKTTIKTVGGVLKDGWNKFTEGTTKVGNAIKDTAIKVWNKATTFVSNAATKVKNFFVDHKEKAWFDTNNCYYKSNGTSFDYYNNAGDKIGEISAEEFDSIKNSLVEGEVNTPSGLKTTIKTVGNTLKEGWNKFTEGTAKVGNSIKDGATKIWNKASNLVTNAATKVKNFLFSKTTTGWYDANGGYYVLNGEVYDYYNNNGDKIGQITADELAELVQSGALTEGEVKIDSGLKTGINVIKNGIKNAFSSIKNVASTALKGIGDAGKQLWSNIKEKGLFGGVTNFFAKEKTKVWFDPNGNYYKLNGDKYDYYNANNDVIAAGIEASVVQEKLEAGLLTQGTVTEDSEAKKAIDKIKSSVSDAWKKAKETVSSGWSKFTSWLTGGKGGSIAHMTSSDYGDKSFIDDPESFVGGPRNKPAKGMRGLNIGGSLSAQDVLSQYNVTSSYGNRSINGKQELHSGIDLTNTLNSPVSSFTSGTVYKVVNGASPNSGNLNSTDGGGFGNYVVVKDKNGNYNYYAHMNGTSVSQGDTVQVGDKLGILGHTGRSTGPHLHYEIRKDPNVSGTHDNTYNPTAYLDSTASDGTPSSSKSSGSLADIFSKLSGFLSEVTNRAFTGITTGKFDSNFDAYFANNMSDDSSDGSSTNYNVDTSGYVKINTSENAKKIWNYYKSRGLPDNTIAGMLGNIHAESGLNPRNLQNSYEKSLGLNDDSYTAAIDSGKYTNFVHDSAGYGLVQWTYHSLKKALLDYARKKGSSIGDLDMQLEFLVKQLSEDYPSTWKKMLNASSPEEVSEIMLREFEKPAVLNTATRAGYAKQYYDTLASQNMGSASIKPRIIKNNKNKNAVYGGPRIDSIDYTRNAVKEYNNANSADKFISSTSNNNMTKAINMIITLLEAITGNTASTSSKLDLLENLKKANIVKGGDTTNIIANTDNSKTSASQDVLNQGSGRKISRNQKLAERIAQGV